jgi:hypothetical protein
MRVSVLGALAPAHFPLHFARNEKPAAFPRRASGRSMQASGGSGLCADLPIAPESDATRNKTHMPHRTIRVAN